MPYYGGPDVGIEYTFVAVVPFDAEHPVGSRQVVRYQPGDTFPGDEWGRAAHNLVEMGKAVRLAVNVGNPGGTLLPPAPAPAPTGNSVEEIQKVLDGYKGDWPAPSGGGWYTLSNGERVRGEDAARMRQSEIGYDS